MNLIINLSIEQLTIFNFYSTKVFFSFDYNDLLPKVFFFHAFLHFLLPLGVNLEVCQNCL